MSKHLQIDVGQLNLSENILMFFLLVMIYK